MPSETPLPLPRPAAQDMVLDMQELLDSVRTQAGLQAQGKDLELTMDVNAAVPQRMGGDARLLAQVLAYFVRQAVLASPRGEVRVSVYPQEANASTMLLRFDVRDSRDTSAHPFILDARICTLVEESFQGSAGTHNLEHQGLNCWFTARLVLVEDPLAIRMAPPTLRGTRMLVVDDNETARLVLVNMLSDMGFWVDAADTGAQALQALQRQAAQGTPYALVMMDWMMPHMDGVELAHQIHTLGLQPGPALLLVTAFNQHNATVLAQRAGIAQVLTKPVAQERLLDAALQALATTAQVNPPRATARKGPHFHFSTPMSYAMNPLDFTHKATLLVVDDNPANLSLMSDLLKDEYRVKVATTGSRALEIARSESKPDLILLDIMMPGLDGYQVCRELKQDPTTWSIPIIFLTARSDAEDEEKGIALGAADYVTKPISPAVVIARIRTQLQLRRYNQSLKSLVEERTAALVRLQKRTERLLEDSIVLQREPERAVRMHRCTTMACELLQTQGCVLYLRSAHGTLEVVAHSEGVAPGAGEIALPAAGEADGQFLHPVARCAVQRETVHIPNVATQTQFDLAGSARLAGSEERLVSVLAVALLHADGSVLGVMQWMNAIGHFDGLVVEFDADLLQLAHLWSRQAACLLESNP